MYLKHKVSSVTYPAYSIEDKSTIHLELNQSLDVGPGDYIVEVSDQDGGAVKYLVIDSATFEKEYLLIKDER